MSVDSSSGRRRGSSIGQFFNNISNSMRHSDNSTPEAAPINIVRNAAATQGLASSLGITPKMTGQTPSASENDLQTLDINCENVPEVDYETVTKRKDKDGYFSLRLTPYMDASAVTPGLYFEPIMKSAPGGTKMIIGRYTEKTRELMQMTPELEHPVVFKSKVVSRTHGRIVVDHQGNWFVRDVGSSSGTFLNHNRLAPASVESRDFLLQDGDILQLGIDFRGGTEEIYRCVKMRVETNKSWKRKANAFNKERLKEMQTKGFAEEDCSICLGQIQPCQSVFISPCSHSWHYKCVRRIVLSSYPQFMCPNCRSVCDLEAELDSDEE